MNRFHPHVSAALCGVLVALAVTLAWTSGRAAGPLDPTHGADAVWLGSGHWRNLLHRELGTNQPGTLSFGPWPARQPGEFGGGGARRQDSGQGPTHLGAKFKAGLLSAILPGAGQYYNGRHQKAYIMGGVEVAIWTAYFVFDTQGDHRRQDAQDFAGIYAGTGGSHDDSYWQNIAHYMDSDAFNEDRYREARALQEPVTGLISPQNSWQWANMDRLYGYRQLRADASSAYDRRDFMILFMVVNRAISVVDAVMGAGQDDPPLGTSVLGMKVRMDISPVWTSPGARCVVSRGF